MSNEWSYEKLAERNYRILNENGSEIVRDIYDEQIAKQIVRDHNAHVARVEALKTAQAIIKELHDRVFPAGWFVYIGHSPEWKQIESALDLAQKESE